jgi:hypothetical protein
MGNKLKDYNKELAKVKKEHPRLPIWSAKIVASDHNKLSRKKRD